MTKFGPLVMAALVVAGCFAFRGHPEPNEPVPSELFAAIVDDAATRAHVDQSSISTLAAAGITWADTSLGCPEPGVVYEQIEVAGYRVVLSASGSDGEYYDYHADRNGRFILCPKDRAAPGVYPSP